MTEFDQKTSTLPSDAPQEASVKDAAARAGGIWTELGPTLAFIVIYNVMLRFPEEGLFSRENALYWATGVLIIATAAVIVMKLIRKQRIPPFLLVSSSLIGVFGILGIVFHSKLLLFLKPTIINLMFAGAIFGGLAVGRNIWKMLFDELFHLPDHAWRVLAIRWGLYFIAMAIWNIVVWQAFGEVAWANWKMGNIVIGFVFAMANAPFMMKHMHHPEER
ncbi:septation protein IspZ [uncultured Hyphomonas sp.]|uniref:inner membrane-spanning protein YciB n=1 Tax=uncultured Hyphomonas sp. TaxID=225298 RepID=UPI002AAA8EA8|nr:septation protein IspZ [uncultured Hyphomonas sp.]